ncbi:ATP-dependent DNA helicase [Candidatus Micrarchaeota archaeon]|nr:ATP-dependent DNA helicase [Candidatus Micrarchaeota archaeon]
MFFPFEDIRPVQKQFYEDCKEACLMGSTLLAYAPTGIGKTAAVLSAVLEYAKKYDKKIIFTTSRHSQHTIAINTLKLIKEKNNLDLVVADIINKQHMCLLSESKDMKRNDFDSFCYHQTKAKKCPYGYVKGFCLMALKEDIYHVEEAKEICKQYGACPHSAESKLIIDADVLVCDYNYIFDSSIRNIVLSKMNIGIEDIILIVDEAHNLPERARELMTFTLSKNLISNCKKELKEYAPDPVLSRAFNIFKNIFEILDGKKEKIIEKKDLINKINSLFQNSFVSEFDFDSFLKKLEQAEEYASSKKENDFEYLNLSEMLYFFFTWMKDNEHILRIVKENEISLFPLDPSDITQPIFSSVHSSILMSGTLYPPKVYADVLGIENPILKEYSSIFPKENRLILSSNLLSTVYHKRNEDEFKKIGYAVSELIEYIPDNSAVFFPSYKLMEEVANYIDSHNEIVLESSDWKKEDKKIVLENMQTKKSLTLLGVQRGSFSEGIDFENNKLKGILIVGIPLDPPSLEKKHLVQYFDKKFGGGKGNEYTYMIPAVNKVLQSAGRGIRGDKDKCAIILLDERFNWEKYKRYFPKDFEYFPSEYIGNHLESFFNMSN